MFRFGTLKSGESLRKFAQARGGRCYLWWPEAYLSQEEHPTTSVLGTMVEACSLNVLALIAGLRYLGPRQRGSMVQRVSTVAFEGIEARAVDVQVQVAPGLPAFAIVGMPDKDGFRGPRAGSLGADRPRG